MLFAQAARRGGGSAARLCAAASAAGPIGAASSRLAAAIPVTPVAVASGLRAAARSVPSVPRRGLAGAAKSAALVFDKPLKLAQRRRAALAPDYANYHYLREELAERLVDRLADINKAFPVAVEIGTGTGAHISSRLHLIASQQSQREAEQRMAAAAASSPEAAAAAAAAGNSSGQRIAPPTQSVPDRGVIRTLHLCDSCPEALARTREYWSSHPVPPGRTHEYHVVDEEGALPFADGSVDLVVSSMSLHWVNDLPGFLKRVRRALKPDGVFLAAMLGGATLQELRSAFTVADLERLGGVQQHVSPFAYGRDCGDLLASAGFTMPTVDTDVLTIRYPDLFTLSAHLQGMGESNASLLRPAAVSRDVMLAAAAAYESLYADEEGLLPATFQVFYLIGWAPDKSQPKPLERGAPATNLADIDRVTAAATDAQPAQPGAPEQAAPFQQ